MGGESTYFTLSLKSLNALGSWGRTALKGHCWCLRNMLIRIPTPRGD
jgi:hypothetical protein